MHNDGQEHKVQAVLHTNGEGERVLSPGPAEGLHRAAEDESHR